MATDEKFKAATAKRLYDIAKTDAISTIGGKVAFASIGGTFRKALVSQMILGILFRQDEVVTDSRVRELLFDLNCLLMDDETLL